MTRLDFTLIGQRSSNGLAAQLDRNAHLWNIITARQEYEGSAHKDTRAIFLRWPPHAADSWRDVATVDMPWLHMLSEAEAIFEHVERWTDTRVVRALIAELKPGGHITPHIDEGEHANATERIHLVLRAEPGNVFKCGDTCIEPRPGEMFYFNHRTTHEVWNHSNYPRVHLIMDVK